MNKYTITYEDKFSGILRVPLEKLLEWDLPFSYEEKSIEDIKSMPSFIYDYEDVQGDKIKIIIPEEEFNIYIYKAEGNCIKYRGGTIGHKIGICISKDDTIEIIELRIVHEILHSLSLRADDLECHITEFMDKTILVFYKILKFLKVHPNHMPFFQRIYYKWLLNKYEG